MKSYRLIVVSILSQLISLLSLKLLTQIVGIDTYGLYLEVLSFTLVFQLISSLKLELGLIDDSVSLENTLQRVRDIRLVSLIFNLFIAGLAAQLFFDSILITLVVITTSYYSNSSNVSTFYDIGQNTFGNIIKYRFFRPFLIFTFQYILLQKFSQFTSLLVGLSAGTWLSYNIGFMSHRFGLNDVRLGSLIIKSKRIVRYSFPSDMLNSFGSQIPILIFSRFFGPDSATVYYTVSKVVITPYAILTESLTKILMRNLLNFKRSNFVQILFKIIDVQFIFFLGGATLLIAFKDFIQDLFLGEEGGDFGTMTYFGMILAFSMFISIPLLSFLNITGNQHKDFRFQLFLLIFRSSGLFLGVYFGSIEVSIIAYFILSSLVYLFYARLGLFSVRISKKKIVRFYLKLIVMLVLFSMLELFFRDSFIFFYVILSMSLLFIGLRYFFRLKVDENN